MIRRHLLLGCLLAALLSVFSLAAERLEFLLLDEIRIGMIGVGKTVVAGDLIETFDVHVLGVIDQPGTLSDFIVVRVSGEVIGRAGGIAQGMSGSPIYIDGKLIGALSRAAHWSKEIMPIGLITPIEPMLAVLDGIRSSESSGGPAPQATLQRVHVVETSAPPTAEQIASATEDTMIVYPVATPLAAVGLSGRSLDLLMHGPVESERPFPLISELLGGAMPLSRVQGLSSYGLTLLPLAAAADSASADPSLLLPGGSVGVALATGDISIGSLGTITYRDGDLLLAYGHPFIENGSSAFPLTHVSIIDTLKSLQASFKLGALGATVGTAMEDRSAAVGGRVGAFPTLVEVEWSVLDEDQEARTAFDLGLVDEPRLMPNLLLSTGFQAIDTTLDRIGQGTVQVTYRIEGRGLSSTLERTDLFLSSYDVALYPAWQLASLVSYLQYNAFQDPEITRISASLSITQEIKGIRIVSLRLDRPYYHPGDTVLYEVHLQTFHGESRVERGSLQIPATLATDFIEIRAYGGPRYLESGESPQEFESLDDIVDAIQRIPSYDQLTVEMFAADLYGFDPYALFGVTEETWTYPGFVVYDSRSRMVPVWPREDEEAPLSPSGKAG